MQFFFTFFCASNHTKSRRELVRIAYEIVWHNYCCGKPRAHHRLHRRLHPLVERLSARGQLCAHPCEPSDGLSIFLKKELGSLHPLAEYKFRDRRRRFICRTFRLRRRTAGHPTIARSAAAPSLQYISDLLRPTVVHRFDRMKRSSQRTSSLIRSFLLAKAIITGTGREQSSVRPPFFWLLHQKTNAPSRLRLGALVNCRRGSIFEIEAIDRPPILA